MEWVRTEDYQSMSRAGAERIAAAIERRFSQGRPMLLGLATGNTMLALYERLAEILNARGLDLAGLHTFNLDEYVGDEGRPVPPDHPLSYHRYMDENLFSRLDPKLGLRRNQVHFPDPACPVAMDEQIAALGGLALQLLGIGFNGHIAFNEPMSESEISIEDFGGLRSRVIELAQQTIEANSRLTAGGDRSQVPRRAVTMGMRPILAAEEILLLACFPEQKAPLEQIRRGRVTPELPASYLLEHPRATILYTGDRIALNGDRN